MKTLTVGMLTLCVCLAGCSEETSRDSADAALSPDADQQADAGADASPTDTDGLDAQAGDAAPGDASPDVADASKAEDVAPDAAPEEGVIFGVYRGGATDDHLQRIADYEAWIGRAVHVRLTYIWENETDWANFERPWQLARWKEWDDGRADRQWAIGVPNHPDGDAYSLEECATGAYNGHFEKLAQALVDNGQEDAILRIGWEFNGGWFPFSAVDKEAAFAGCWREIVDTMRAVPGQAFVMNWNPTMEEKFDVDAAWPGDGYVDEIGIDVYDVSWGHYVSDNCSGGTCPAELQRATWRDIHDGTDWGFGLQDWVDFAQRHGKPLSLPEWGLNEISEPDGTWRYGGGDNPYFIEKMHAWIHDPTNNVRWAAYFDVHPPDGDHKLYGETQFPESKAKFLELFGR